MNPIFELKTRLFKPYVTLMRWKERHRGGVVKSVLDHFNYTPSTYRFLADINKKYPLGSDPESFQNAVFQFLTEAQLSEDAIAFDLGAFHGNWASMINEKFACSVFAFEPNPRAYKRLQQRFEGRDGIRLYQFGLSNKDFTAELAMHGEGSNIYQPDPHGLHDREIKTTEVQLFGVSEFLEKEQLDYVDFAKLNIEGGEYDLLEHLINTGEIEKFGILNIQFHEWLPKAHARRRNIRKNLEKTHRCEWSYPFIWERWAPKKEKLPK